MNEAYASDDGAFIAGNSLYIAGTRSAEDVSYWPTVHNLSAHPRFKTASKLVGDPRVKRVVGHSLGGAIAAQIGKQATLPSVTYKSPIPGDESYVGAWDPLTALSAWFYPDVPQISLREGHSSGQARPGGNLRGRSELRRR